MNVCRRAALLLVAVLLAVVAGCTEPNDPGAPANQPAASQGDGGIPGY